MHLGIVLPVVVVVMAWEGRETHQAVQVQVEAAQNHHYPFLRHQCYLRGNHLLLLPLLPLFCCVPLRVQNGNGSDRIGHHLTHAHALILDQIPSWNGSRLHSPFLSRMHHQTSVPAASEDLAVLRQGMEETGEREPVAYPALAASGEAGNLPAQQLEVAVLEERYYLHSIALVTVLGLIC